jgi:hypothetical protein
MKHEYDFKIINSRVKVYVDGYVMFTFNQIEFKGYYSYKDDTDLYGINIYLMNQNGSSTMMKLEFNTKEHWTNILKILDDNL